MIALNQDFYSVFLAKMDVKKDHKCRSKPGLAHIGPDLGSYNAFIPKDVPWDSLKIPPPDLRLAYISVLITVPINNKNPRPRVQFLSDPRTAVPF